MIIDYFWSTAAIIKKKQVKKQVKNKNDFEFETYGEVKTGLNSQTPCPYSRLCTGCVMSRVWYWSTVLTLPPYLSVSSGGLSASYHRSDYYRIPYRTSILRAFILRGHIVIVCYSRVFLWNLAIPRPQRILSRSNYYYSITVVTICRRESILSFCVLFQSDPNSPINYLILMKAKLTTTTLSESASFQSNGVESHSSISY
jgi:hypothetical protein